MSTIKFENMTDEELRRWEDENLTEGLRGLGCEVNAHIKHTALLKEYFSRMREKYGPDTAEWPPTSRGEIYASLERLAEQRRAAAPAATATTTE